MPINLISLTLDRQVIQHFLRRHRHHARFLKQDIGHVSIRQSFATACRRVGIRDFWPHDLRHTCAAWLVRSSVDWVRVRDLLHHKSVQMTECYTHLVPHNVRSAVKILDEIVVSGPAGP